MQGKYSPTVSAAYAKDQQWHDNHCHPIVGVVYDHDGFDSYGYDLRNIDRAGNHEDAYASDDALYEQTSGEWTFDGRRPKRAVQVVVAPMNQIMTITLPDGSTLTGPVTERILTPDNRFFNFEVYSTKGRVTVRVDNKDQYDDMKERGVI